MNMSTTQTRNEQWEGTSVIRALEACFPGESSPRSSVSELKQAIAERYERDREQLEKKLQDALEEQRRVEASLVEKFPGGVEMVKKRLQFLRNGKTNAFPMEKAGIENEMQSLNALLKEPKKASTAVQAAQTSLKQFDARRDDCLSEIDYILKAFPSAELLDLSCLSLFRLENGLPALAMFDLDRAKAAISIDSRGKLLLNERKPDGKNDSLEILPDEFQTLAKQVIRATNVDPFNAASVKCASARQLIMTAEFPPTTIPDEARRLALQANESGLFDRVRILAEVPKWELRYVDLVRPELCKITGDVTQPVKREPLILGCKKIAGRHYTFLIGAFNLRDLKTWLKEQRNVKG